MLVDLMPIESKNPIAKKECLCADCSCASCIVARWCNDFALSYCNCNMFHLFGQYSSTMLTLVIASQSLKLDSTRGDSSDSYPLLLRRLRSRMPLRRHRHRHPPFTIKTFLKSLIFNFFWFNFVWLHFFVDHYFFSGSTGSNVGSGAKTWVKGGVFHAYRMNLLKKRL
jgi:hypothetical protein